MTDAHEIVGRRLEEAGLGTDRFITVDDGAKRSVDHDTRWSDPQAVPGRNYGVYADAGGPLVVLDIDDHDGGDDGVSAAGVAALGALPPTLETESPHGGTHRFYRVSDADDGLGELLKTRLGVFNPVPSWGEVQARSKYVVGAGSQLDGCDKDWCESCADAAGGGYVVGSDRPVAEIDGDTLVEALAADPELSDGAAQSTLDDGGGGREASTGGDGGEAFDGYDADAETVRDALACVSPDLDYDEWRNIGWAVCDAVDGDRETARELFVAWSRGDFHAELADGATAAKWDSDARNRAERIVSDWSPPTNGDVTAGTLWHRALASSGPAEWTPPADWGNGDDPDVRRTPPDSEASSPEASGSPADGGVDASDGDAGDGEGFDGGADGDGDGAAGTATESDGGDGGGPAVSPECPAGELVYDESTSGAYGYWNETTDRDGETMFEWAEVTNFRLETLAVIDADGETRLRVRVVPETEESAYEVEVHPTVFNETRTFKEEVVRGRTTTFENARGDALDDLRLSVGQQQCPRHTGVAHVGPARPVHDDNDELPGDAWNEWVTPDGVLTADGWLEAGEGDHTYIARSQSQTGDESIVGEKWNLTPSHDTVDEREVREVLRRLPRARLPDRALATLAWFYTAPLKPLIYHAEEEFPHLSVRGKTAAGKTAWLSTLSKALGMDGTPFAADATSFSLEMMHVGSRGAPVWIDEYKPSQMSPGRQDKLHTYLREATREAVHTKGRPDQSFISYRMQSPVCLSGEQTIKEPAVARRAMKVNLSSRATDMQSTQQAYAEVAGEAYETPDGSTEIGEGFDLTAHALAYHRWLLSHDAEELLADWHDCRDETSDLLDAVDATNVSDTERLAVQQTVFGWQLFNRFGAAYGVESDELVSQETLQEAVAHITENVGKNGQRREHGDELLELVSQAAQAGYLDPDDAERGDTPFRVYEPETAAGDAVALHLPTVYPAVRKFVRDYSLESEYNLLSKTDYTDEFGDVAGPNSHILAVSKVVREVMNGDRKRCLVVDATRARQRLGEDWVASAFGAELADDEIGPSGGGGDGGDGEISVGGDDSDSDTHGNAGGDERLSPVDVTPSVSDARGRVPAFEADVTSVWADRYGNETVGLSDGEAVVTATVVGPDRPGLREGARVVVAAARAVPDDFGNLELEIDPETEVAVVSTPGDDEHDGGAALASTDGGTATAADAADPSESQLEPPRVVDRTADDTDPDVYIGRGNGGTADMTNTEPPAPGWLGNPHTVDADGREAAVQQFAETFAARLRERPAWGARVAREIDGATLGCYCKPEACHGDVLREWAVSGEISRVDEPVPSPTAVVERGGSDEPSETIGNGGGGSDHETVRGRLTEWLQTERPETVTVPQAAAEIDASPGATADALARLTETGVLIDRGDEWVVAN